MESTTFVDGVLLPDDGRQVEAQSLYETLAKIKDGRKRRGRRYQVALVLTLIVLAKMAGETSLSGIADWARLRIEGLRPALSLVRATLPCANTYRYVCDHIDLDELNEKLAGFFSAVEERARQSLVMEAKQSPSTRGEYHLALDGKSLRGTAGRQASGHGAVQLLGLYHVTHRYMVRQVALPGPGREQETAFQLIRESDLTGCVVSADALHTQPAWCQRILDQGGDYLLIAKRNQPTLREDIALLFSQAPVRWLPEGKACSVDKGHGRLEVRRLRTSQELGDYLAPKWPAVAQVFQVERQITKGGKTTTEIRYGLTSLPTTVCSARRLLGLIRDHWHIENRVHWRRDVTLKEDASKVREGQTPHALAALNNVVLTLMDYLEVPNMAAQIRVFEARLEDALSLILSPL
jgi:predicted transposase YbfD/YdcC